MTALPQLDGRTLLTDGVLETWLIFERGIELPELACRAWPCSAAAAARIIGT